MPLEEQELGGEVLPPAEVEKSDPLSSKFAMLARKEKAISNRIMELQKREEMFKAKESEYETSYISKKKFQESPLDMLNEMGIGYDKLTEMMLNYNGTTDPTILALQRELKELKDEQVKSKSQYEENNTKAYQNAVEQIRKEVKALVLSDENFDSIREAAKEDEVVSRIEKKFKEESILMTVEEACRELEDELMDQALKMASWKKVKEKLSPIPPVQDLEGALQAQKKDSSMPQRTPTTLTNAIAQTPSKPLTKEQIRERAIRAFRGELV